MSRIRWYGPTLVLLVTVLMVMIVGPRLTQQLAYTHKRAELQLVAESLINSNALAQLSDSFRKVAKVVEPSVVSIQVSHRVNAANRRMDRQTLERFFEPFGPGPFDRFFRDQQDDQPQQDDGGRYDQYNPLRPFGSGSGWVYDDRGHVITNNHVITLPDHTTIAAEIKVKFSDGRERIATVVGTDPKTDIAVLKVDGPVIPARHATARVEQGDIVFAFGSPFRFDFSMSQGIVSATDRRQVGILAETGGYENFIQTDAAINPGNSGGPLTNIYGEVVGMNTAIASRTGTYNGLGFAIPIDMIKQVAGQIIDKGKVVRGFLGIQISDMDPKLAKSFGISDGSGVLVRKPLDDSPAAKAGVLANDIITSVDGRRVQSADDLRNYVASKAPGSKLKLTLLREGQEKQVNVVITEMPTDVAVAGGDEAVTGTPAAQMELLRKVGLEQVATLTEDLAQRGRMRYTPGVLVMDVRPQSAAAAAGISRGAIITAVMDPEQKARDIEVKTVEDLVRQLGRHDLTQGVRIRVLVNNTPAYVMLELPKE